MYICVFSRSEGAGKATTRNTRGLTRSVSALIVPPLPAASRPSNTMTTRRPLYLTQSCSWHSPVCRRRNSCRYSLFFIAIILLLLGTAPPLIWLVHRSSAAWPLAQRAGQRIDLDQIGNGCGAP